MSRPMSLSLHALSFVRRRLGDARIHVVKKLQLWSANISSRPAELARVLP